MKKDLTLLAFTVFLFFISCKKGSDTSPTPLPPPLYVLNADHSFLNLNGTTINSIDSFSIQSNVTWAISISPVSATWFTPSITSGNGNGKIYLTVNQNNNTGGLRTATITIAAVGNSSVPSVTISVNQPQQDFLIWSKLFGGTLDDWFTGAIKTSDGGYLVTGNVSSNDGDVTLNHPGPDLWAIKFSSAGIPIWKKTFGGSNYDFGSSIVESNDGGYVFAGSSTSNDGDAPGNHGNFDIWVIKLDVNGNVIWKKSYGGSGWDGIGRPGSMVKTNDGGFVIVGVTGSTDGDVTGNHPGGHEDGWVLKIDGNGNKVWQKCLGGTSDEYAYGVAASSDGGYVVVLTAASNDGDITGNHGNNDVWAVKLDGTGNIIWQKTFGGTASDYGLCIVGTPDGGYAIGGGTESNDGDVTGSHGSRDVWIIKINAVGTLVWQRTLGGSGFEEAYGIIQSGDGGFVATGSTGSNNGDVSPNNTKPDAWIVKVNGNGNMLWQKCLGGIIYEDLYSIVALPNNEFLTAGRTASNYGDFSTNHGGIDGWICKFRDPNY